MLNRQMLELEISPRRLIRQWGKERRRLRKTALEKVELPATSKLYLAEIGLPPEWLHFKFDFEPIRFMSLAEVVEEAQQAGKLAQSLAPHPLDLKQYRYLGNNQVVSVGVEEPGGAVFLVDIIGHPATNGIVNPYLERSLMNSSVQRLGQFLYLYELALERLDVGELTASEIHQLNRRFRELDQAAMDDLDLGLWPTTLEELLLFNFEEEEWEEASE